MRACSWDAIEVNGHPMQAPPDGPQRFIPVFDSQEQAIAFAVDGDRIAPVRMLSLADEGSS
jgi:hypothetical protein